MQLDVRESIRTFLQIAVISAVVFHIIFVLENRRIYYYNQEVFDLNSIPQGLVVWIYPKNKKMDPLIPDTLNRRYDSIRNEYVRNYNVDVWKVAIQTVSGEVIIFDVPDYASQYFELNKVFRAPPEPVEEKKYFKDP